MDIAPPSTAPLSNTTQKYSPEPERETPTRIQPSKFSNGVLKRHHTHHHHHHLAPPIVIIYKECLKNHAATLGGHAVDGCGEFMPSPSATPTDPTSLKCAACGCHRNFHRREPEDPPPSTTTATIEFQPHHRHHPPPPPPPPASHCSPNSASPPPISSSYYPSAPHMLLALSGGLSAPPDGTNIYSHLPANPKMYAGGVGVTSTGLNSKKRFRTKFSPIQKEKMFKFAETIGWKMQKRDDELVQEFCNEIGVDRGVLKVWMHNNKNTFGKRDLNGGSADGNNNCDHGGGHNIDNNENHENDNIGQNLNHHYEHDSVAHVATNGSSSSS